MLGGVKIWLNCMLEVNHATGFATSFDDTCSDPSFIEREFAAFVIRRRRFWRKINNNVNRDEPLKQLKVFKV